MARFLVILSLALIGFTFANQTAYNFAYPSEEGSSSSS
jgi:hypothetical protein